MVKIGRRFGSDRNTSTRTSRMPFVDHKTDLSSFECIDCAHKYLLKLKYVRVPTESSITQVIQIKCMPLEWRMANGKLRSFLSTTTEPKCRSHRVSRTITILMRWLLIRNKSGNRKMHCVDNDDSSIIVDKQTTTTTTFLVALKCAQHMWNMR